MSDGKKVTNGFGAPKVPPKRFHGNKARLTIKDPKTGKETVVAVFDNVKFVPNYDISDAYVLGGLDDEPDVEDRRKRKKKGT
jgi:hypothetical protein